ncbi:kanamycin nucleotidyltransferase C-terminal domain-containing protein [Paenibacillus prosopidis]|uniref:Nucleotidyltransferase-like protein n=1 Tax=Paenibacillus prosopidis TaxID=630520 RepID=A0A368W299_9BACL|nr:kanamycin nucleotidyltransferase C-terminal domain-containing protein [Paenibacillus prosopidis]RCW49155.1 nucleotidyltransferase-like protein [Paenibacillus prosopidis]
MPDVFAVADTLIKHIKNNYSNDIAIVAYYGSYAQGTATKRSDLDFFFIPASADGYRASIQFILDDISFDFWPISWERAERMASLADPQTTIIADCRLLYARSDEDRNRFMRLRDSIAAIQEPEHGLQLTQRAESLLHDAYVHLYKMSRMDPLADLTFYRSEAYDVLTKVIQSLGLLNQTYFTVGWGKNKDQILRLPLKPDHLESLYETIITAQLPADIRSACERLTEATLELVAKHRGMYSTAPSYPDRMKGFYEETKGTFDKIITACEKNDYDTAYFAAIRIQDEIAYFLHLAEKGYPPFQLELNSQYQVYKKLGLPDLIHLLAPGDLKPLQAAVVRLDVLLLSHLKANGVEINSFESIEQFESFLRTRSVR